MSDRPERAGEILARLAARGEAPAGLRAEAAAQRGRLDAEFPRLRADLMGRMDRLTAVRGDIGVECASPDRAARPVRPHREEIVTLEEQVSALTRAAHTLQEQVQGLRDERG